MLRQWEFLRLYLRLPQELTCPVARDQQSGEDVPPVLPAQGAAAPHLLLPALHLQGPLPGGLLLPGQLPAGVQGVEPAGLFHQPLDEGQARPQHTGAGSRPQWAVRGGLGKFPTFLFRVPNDLLTYWGSGI